MNQHRLTGITNDRGYSVKQICTIMNRNGVKVHYNRLCDALKEKPNKTARELYLVDQYLDTLKTLPDIGFTDDGLLAMMRQHNIHIVDLWRYYQRTRPKSVCYRSFCAACKYPSAPYEYRIREEARACLREVLEQNAEGRA